MSLNGLHGNNKQDDILQEFYQKLSYFLMSGEHSNKEIMEEIEIQISKLQEKVNQKQQLVCSPGNDEFLQERN